MNTKSLQEWSKDWEKMMDPHVRLNVIKGMMSTAAVEDLEAITRSMEVPAIVPTEDDIQNADTESNRIQSVALTLVGAPGHQLVFMYFEGVGSLFMHLVPGGACMWGDAIRGEGSKERKCYLEKVANTISEGRGVVFSPTEAKAALSHFGEAVPAEKMN